MTGISPTPQKTPFFADIYYGAVRGDFASEYIGVAGRVTQAILGFVPILAELFAIRDFIADRRQHDYLGAFINVLAFIPIIGGFAKILLAWRSIRRKSHGKY